MASSNTIAPHDLIEEIIKDEDQVHILRTLRENSAQPHEIENCCSLSDSSLFSRLTSLETKGLIESSSKTRQITSTGKIALRECLNTCNDVDRERIAYLADSDNRPKVLRALRDSPVQPCEINKRDDLPSRPTVGRCLDTFVDYNWAVRNNRYAITEKGDRELTKYDRLWAKMEQVATKQRFLRHLGLASKDIPLKPLASGDYQEATEGAPHALITDFNDALDTDLEQFRGMNPVFSKPCNDAVVEHIRAGAQLEVVIDRTAFKLSSLEYPGDFDNALQFSNLDIYVYPGTLEASIALLDDETALIGAYDDQKRLVAGLESNHSELLDWAIQVYEDRRSKAYHIPTSVSSVKELPAGVGHHLSFSRLSHQIRESLTP